MINLLPPELKREYRYARSNHRLVHWVIAFLVAIIGVVGLTGAGLLMMNNSVSKYQSKVNQEQEQLDSQNITGVQKEVTQISNNLNLMVDVLSKEILFSKLLTQLGSITPPNVVLTNLAISQTESAIDITAQTADYNAATQLQINLADPSNQIFSNADIVNVTCGGANTTTAQQTYPCTAILRAQFTKNNPFLFINNNAKAGS